MSFYSGLRRVAKRFAPLFRFVPKGLRQSARAKLEGLQKADPRPPLAYVPDAHPVGVNLIGLFRAEMGLGQGARLYAKALERSGLPHALIDTDFLFLSPQRDDSFRAKLSNQPKYAINVTHLNPDQYRTAAAVFPAEVFDKRYNIAVWLWELENIPEEWHWAFAHLNEIWTPSRFVQEAVQKVSPVPVTLLPYGIEAPVEEGCARASFGLPEGVFVVLCMFDASSFVSRKNPMAAVEAFIRAFGQRAEPAVLVVKINHPKVEDVQAIKARFGDSKNLVVISETMRKKRVNALIQCCDVLISLHRSEGFGLILAEAMLLGTPVVATNWSANTEFMHPGVACMVDYRLIPTGGDYAYGHARQRWADADIDQAAAYLTRLYEDKGYYEEIARAGQTHIAQRFPLEGSALAIKRRVGEICGQGIR